MMAAGRIIGVIGVLLVTGAVLPAHSSPPAGACQFQTPADLDAAPARWLGACINGAADGLGIIRAGTEEPYAFFAGQMQGGRPTEGLLVLREGGWMVAVRFDEAFRVVSSGGLRPEEDDHVFAQAHAAALETAARFRQDGNRGSADYYASLAQRITEGRPE